MSRYYSKPFPFALTTCFMAFLDMVSRLKSQFAPGPDGIPYQCWKAALRPQVFLFQVEIGQRPIHWAPGRYHREIGPVLIRTATITAQSYFQCNWLTSKECKAPKPSLQWYCWKTFASNCWPNWLINPWSALRCTQGILWLCHLIYVRRENLLTSRRYAVDTATQWVIA